MCDDRLTAFEKMLSDIQSTAERERQAMTELKAAGKEKTATYNTNSVKTVGFDGISIERLSCAASPHPPLCGGIDL